MEDLQHREIVRAFYESLGNNILYIGGMDIPESEKEKLYLKLDKILEEHERGLESSLKSDSNKRFGKLRERLGDITLGLEEPNKEDLWESLRDAENRRLAVGIFGARRLYSERD